MTPALPLAHHTLSHAGAQFAIYFGPVIVLVLVLVIASRRHARSARGDDLIELDDDEEEVGRELSSPAERAPR